MHRMTKLIHLTNPFDFIDRIRLFFGRIWVRCIAKVWMRCTGRLCSILFGMIG